MENKLKIIFLGWKEVGKGPGFVRTMFGKMSTKICKKYSNFNLFYY
jgi:hypothetical protein